VTEVRRVPHLPSAIVGNGALLATLSARGEVERLFWPHVDWAQQLGELRIGVTSPTGVDWLDERGFEHAQEYLEDANVLRTTATNDRVRVEILDVVDHQEPVLCRRIVVEGAARLVVYVRPTLEGHDYAGAFVDPGSGAVVFYRREHAFAVGLTPSAGARVGRIDQGGSPVFADCADGELTVDDVQHGAVDGALLALAGSGHVTCTCAFGSTPGAALRLLEVDADALLRRRIDRDRLALQEAAVPHAEPELYRRSLLALDLLTDRATGAVIAAPELDDEFRVSGGYGFAWARDVAFVVMALLAAGRDEPARKALRWLVRAQSPEGLWLHRHWTSGALAPSWGLHQIDETGSALVAFEVAWRTLEDATLDDELWPAARRGADFLVGFRDPATGLTLPSVDLWEERVGEHAYSAAAAAAGLSAAASMAERHDPRLAGGYARAAAALRDAIELRLWDPERGRYRRSIPGPPSASMYPNRRQLAVEHDDDTVDVSLLGLAWPFAVVDPAGARMRATAAAVERELGLPDGGLRRYSGDTYAGGNSWTVAVLWLGLWYRLVGDERGHRRCLDYAVKAQTSVGLLPEQVAQDGKPAWVVPLAWSHAMLALAVRPEIATRTASRTEITCARTATGPEPADSRLA
jgi:GH15 family glucan-1,4-alpha-glucosidase